MAYVIGLVHFEWHTKAKLTILAFLYCGVFVKNSNIGILVLWRVYGNLSCPPSLGQILHKSMADKGGKKQFMFHGLRLTNSRLPTISFEFGFDDKPLLEIIAKCCVLIREWCGLYYALLDVSMSNIALFVIVDDCTAERAIIASNGFKLILGNFLKIYVERPSPFSATANPGSVTNIDQANVMSMLPLSETSNR